MPSSLTYYFAGVGTAGVALVVGFGGALIFSNAVMKDTPPAPTRVERVAATQEALSPNVSSFPSQIVPAVMATPAPLNVPRPNIPTRTLATSETASVSEAEQLESRQILRAAKGPVTLGHMSEVSELPDPVTAEISQNQGTRPQAHSQEDSAEIATAKRLREIELKRARVVKRVDEQRNANRQKQLEIAAAADAVRRMLRDRRNLREDAMERSIELGFATEN